MTREKIYNQTHFSPEVIRKAADILDRQANKGWRDTVSLYLWTKTKGETWAHESEDEFFSDYRRGTSYASYRRQVRGATLCVFASEDSTTVSVEAEHRSLIHAVFEVFEEHLSESRQPARSEPISARLEKEKKYPRTRFSPEVITQAVAVLDQETNKDSQARVDLTLVVQTNGETWTHAAEEEFFSDYRRGTSYAVYRRRVANASLSVRVTGDSSIVGVEAEHRQPIQAVFEVFENHLNESQLPEPPAPPEPKATVFIGHGRSPLWRELKDHLQDKHGYTVEAYEIGAGAGHAVRDILEDMLKRSSIAFLVMTAEDETTEGGMRARQNVVHETGLFQGKLGFTRAIVLLEQGTEEFSNIHGIDQIRFTKGNIRETFGEVVATINREFPDGGR